MHRVVCLLSSDQPPIASLTPPTKQNKTHQAKAHIVTPNDAPITKPRDAQHRPAPSSPLNAPSSLPSGTCSPTASPTTHHPSAATTRPTRTEPANTPSRNYTSSNTKSHSPKPPKSPHFRISHPAPLARRYGGKLGAGFPWRWQGFGVMMVASVVVDVETNLVPCARVLA